MSVKGVFKKFLKRQIGLGATMMRVAGQLRVSMD